MSASAGEWVCVGPWWRYGARTPVRVRGRLVTILRVPGGAGAAAGEDAEQLRCVDSMCYHAGGPLFAAPLEAVGARTCARCPWHAFLVDIESGEALYLDLARRVRSAGVRQRVHDVQRREDHVWVRLREAGAVASDHFARGPPPPARAGAGEVPEFPAEDADGR